MNKPDDGFDRQQEDFQEEWLSAYLDGELSAQQRSVVEERLQYDSNVQQMMLDLQKVRSLVADLPTWPAHFGKVDSQQVLLASRTAEEPSRTSEAPDGTVEEPSREDGDLRDLHSEELADRSRTGHEDLDSQEEDRSSEDSSPIDLVVDGTRKASDEIDAPSSHSEALHYQGISDQVAANLSSPSDAISEPQSPPLQSKSDSIAPQVGGLDAPEDLERLSEQVVAPPRSRRGSSKGFAWRWTRPLGVAASLLAIVGISSYLWYNRSSQPTLASNTSAQNEEKDQAAEAAPSRGRASFNRDALSGLPEPKAEAFDMIGGEPIERPASQGLNSFSGASSQDIDDILLRKSTVGKTGRTAGAGNGLDAEATLESSPRPAAKSRSAPRSPANSLAFKGAQENVENLGLADSAIESSRAFSAEQMVRGGRLPAEETPSVTPSNDRALSERSRKTDVEAETASEPASVPEIQAEIAMSPAASSSSEVSEAVSPDNAADFNDAYADRMDLQAEENAGSHLGESRMKSGEARGLPGSSEEAGRPAVVIFAQSRWTRDEIENELQRVVGRTSLSLSNDGASPAPPLAIASFEAQQVDEVLRALRDSTHYSQVDELATSLRAGLSAKFARGQGAEAIPKIIMFTSPEDIERLVKSKKLGQDYSEPNDVFWIQDADANRPAEAKAKVILLLNPE